LPFGVDRERLLLLAGGLCASSRIIREILELAERDSTAFASSGASTRSC
jgi:hypothetical protein